MVVSGSRRESFPFTAPPNMLRD